jgi:hypothetical protein
MGFNIHRGTGGYSLDGDYRDHPVRIQYIPGGEDSTPQTNFEVKCQNLAKIDMEISGRGIKSKLMGKLGRKYIEIGVPEFDKRFVIRGNPENDVKFILDDSTQHKIRTLKHFSYLKLHLNQIKVNFEGIITRERLLKSFLDVIVDIAEKVEGTEHSTYIAREFSEKFDTIQTHNLEKTKFCPECGTENPEEARFCQECDHEL